MLQVANAVLCIAVRLLGFDIFWSSVRMGTNASVEFEDLDKREDMVLVSPWDFQSEKRGDIISRYKSGQADWPIKKGYITTS